MVDSDGFRPNIGIMLCNDDGKLLWARRVNQDAWQFPQGGIGRNESPEEALYRELFEEVGLTADDVRVLGRTRHWLRYRLPRNLVRFHSKPVCIGQKQIWFLLQIKSRDDSVCLDRYKKPEFDRWRWIDYWEPIEWVVQFKRRVYACALNELASLILPESSRDMPDKYRQLVVLPEIEKNHQKRS